MITTTSPPARRAGATLVALAALTAAAALVVASGRTLPFPGDLRPAGLATWADEVGGPTAAFTFLRALACALVGWCAAGWVLGVAARLVRRPAAIGLTDRLSLPIVRRLADAVAGLAVMGATLSPVAVAASPAPTIAEFAIVVMTDLGPAPSPAGSTTTTPVTAPPSTTTTTTTSVGPGTAVPSPVLPSTPPALDATTPTDRVRDAVEPTPRHAGSVGPTWVIAPGDTLWHVAEASLADELGHTPSPAEIVQQLDRLIAANLDRLAVPGEPDLVFPGQEFVIP